MTTAAFVEAAAETSAERRVRAAASAGRAAGYCWLEHPDGGAHCTRSIHSDRRHVDFYNGKTSPLDASGVEWWE